MAMRYGAVHTQIWQSRSFRSLTDEGKMLFLYLLTSPHANLTGVYLLPLAYAQEDLCWGQDTMLNALEQLIEAEMVKYDHGARVVCVLNYMKYNPISNQKQATGALNALRSLPETPLICDFISAVKRHCPTYADLFDGLPIPYPCPSDSIAKKAPTDTPTDTPADTEENVAPDGPTPPDDPPEPKHDEGSVAYQLAQHLRTAILMRDQETKVPDETPEALERWATEADRMVRLDGRDPHEAAELMTWCQRDPFWSSNVLSMTAFRKQYDRLKRQSQQPARADPRASPGRMSYLERELREAGAL
jgi:hypothetical protein